MLDKKSPLRSLLDNVPQQGKLDWIGLRTARHQLINEVAQCQVVQGQGLVGDHFSGSLQSKRQVTLIQAEHLPVIAACLGIAHVKPEQLRRNLVVSGINLLAFKNKQFSIGSVIFEMTGLCHPCSRMEQEFGLGGYNALRGHGGITARVVLGGEIKIGDCVSIVLTR